MSFRDKIMDFIFDVYTSPFSSNYRAAMSLRNRLLKDYQHLAGLVLLLNRLPVQKYGNLILDIGCHSGISTDFLAQRCLQFDVVGFEAIRSVYEKASQTYGKNERVRFENIALSETSGMAEFFIADNLVSSSLNCFDGRKDKFSLAKKEQVQKVSLDAYMLSKNWQNLPVACMKIDVQGHEVQVLKGASESLKRTKYLLLEMANHSDYDNGAQYHEVDAHLRKLGFQLQNIFAPFSYDTLYEFDAIYVNKSI